MRPIKRLIALAIVGLSAAAVARAEDPALPTPPQQNEPWTPPETRLPRFLVTAAQTLFEQGLADPRGCEYRSIRIQLGDAQGGRMDVSTTGWALPAPDGGKPRFAITWSGLVHPLLEVGEPADLDLDVDNPQRAERRRVAPGRMPMPAFNRGRGGDGKVYESAAISLELFHPIQVCLLLRLGRADLAETLWTRNGRALAPKSTGAGPNLDLRSYGVSYLSLATDFAWFRYSRAIREHLSGEDALALADARALDAFRRAADAKAAEMGFAPQGRGVAFPELRSEPVSRYINFLDQAPALLADQERRARERANPLPPPPEGDKVAPLIRALDQVTTTPQAIFMNGNFAGPFGDSPTIKALIDLGDEAVEPLIQALRTDDRLTRSLDLGGGPFRDQTIMRADRAAYLTLTKILKVSSFGPTTMRENNGEPIDKNALADRIQEYWDKNKAIPILERWYRTLANDKAGAAAWLEAAGSITRAENPQGQPRAALFVEGLVPPAPQGKPRLQGDPLREGHSPTVTELLIRRIESVRTTPAQPSLGMNQAMQMAGHLATWDADAASPALRDLAKDYRDRYARAKAGKSSYDARNLAMSIARLTTLRAKAGDRSALDEYAEWIRTVSSIDPQDPTLQAVLEPIREHPENPNLAAAADWLFNDPQSPWAAAFRPKEGQAVSRLGWMVSTPTMEVPAFRKMIQNIALADRAVVGKAEFGENGQVNIKFNDNSSMGGMTSRDLNNPDAPPIGAKADVRARDFYAWRLSGRGGAPYFNPCWPEPKRDAAIEKIVEFLKSKERP